MIQIFDTHRMDYRNAKLRAFALADNTRRLDFYNFANINVSNADNCGNEIETDEAGYLFYGGGQHRILCLGLQESAIIEVSLDGGTTWQIQWIIHEPTGNGNATEPATLSWRNANGVIETYSPTGNNKSLPEYLLKRDYQSGKWAEEEVILAANDGTLQVPPWTKTLLISQAAPATITLTAKPRHGQVIVINACRDVTLIYSDAGVTRQVGTIKQAHTYMLVNFVSTGGYNHGYPMLVDISSRDIEMPLAQQVYIDPTWLQSGANTFITQAIYNLPINGTIIVNFNYLNLPGTGFVTGVKNTFKLRVYGEVLKRWPLAVFFEPASTYPGAAGTQVELQLETYASDGVTVTSNMIIAVDAHTTTNAARILRQVRYTGGRYYYIAISAAATTDTQL